MPQTPGVLSPSAALFVDSMAGRQTRLELYMSVEQEGRRATTDLLGIRFAPSRLSVAFVLRAGSRVAQGFAKGPLSPRSGRCAVGSCFIALAFAMLCQYYDGRQGHRLNPDAPRGCRFRLYLTFLHHHVGTDVPCRTPTITSHTHQIDGAAHPASVRAPGS
jgi:hypothetical protein